MADRHFIGNLILMVGFLFIVTGNANAGAGDKYLATQQHLKDKHFIVYYSSKNESAFAREVLRRAEDYYHKIADRIGYSRYSNFWTWEERVKIIVFPDQNSYTATTGVPSWSTGYSDSDSALFQSRIIVTFRQQENFFDGLLPHEISHLILRDFLGLKTDIPIWFDEGVAQLEEKNKSDSARQYMQMLVEAENQIPFSLLLKWDVRGESDPQKVSIFYVQSLSVVEFMIRKYGSSAFGILCRSIRDGMDFEGALHKAYPRTISSAGKLEEKWIKYIQENE